MAKRRAHGAKLKAESAEDRGWEEMITDGTLKAHSSWLKEMNNLDSLIPF